MPNTTKQLQWICIFAIFLCALLPLTWAATCPGCVELDELNFDSTVERFPYALIKFDIAFPYGDKHEAFAEFSKAAHKVTKDLLVGTVGIKDYGENENKVLGLRFDVDDKNFPAIFLFKGGKLENFLQFPAHLDVTLNNLRNFVTDNTELYIGRDGCLKEFNEYAKKYANKPDEEQVKLIQKAEEHMKKLTQPGEQKNAKIYLVYMRKINEKGYDFVEEESKRLLRLKAGKVTDAKKKELKEKLNILDVFRVTKLTKVSKKVEEEL